MKSLLTTLFIVLLAASTVHTAPALSSDADQFQQAAVEKMIARRDDGLSISCDACQGRLDDCLKVCKNFDALPETATSKDLLTHKSSMVSRSPKTLSIVKTFATHSCAASIPWSVFGPSPYQVQRGIC